MGLKTPPMAAPPAYPPAAQLRVLADQLAAKVVPRRHLSGNPHARIGEQHIFAERLIEVVLRVRERDRRSTSTTPGALLPEAADAARRLDDAYARMNRGDCDWVEHIKKTQPQFLAGKIEDIPATIANLSALLHTALGRSYPVPKSRLYRQFGMRRPRVRDQMLRELVFGLLAAARDSGGKLSFNVNSGSGTLANVLDRLRRHLPTGLVPQPVASRSRTIQRIKNEFNRLSSRSPKT
jgi:hypothetical protein